MPMASNSIRDLAAFLIVTALLILALVLGRDVLMPLALATILAFILAPFVRFLIDQRAPRALAVGCVTIAFVASIIASSIFFSAQLLALTASLANYKENLVQKLDTVTKSGSGDSVIGRAVASIELLDKALQADTRRSAPGSPDRPVIVAREASTRSYAYLEQIPPFLSKIAFLGLTLLFMVLMLSKHQDIRDRIVRLAGTDNMTSTTSALSDAGTKLSRLFSIQAGLNAGFGVMIAIVLLIVGVPNAALWGVAAMFLRFVPVIGVCLSALPPILLAAAVDPGWSAVIVTAAAFLAGELVFGHVLEPMLLGRGSGMSQFAIIIATAFWALVWGPIGLILAAPLSMCLVVLGQNFPKFEFITLVLGDQPALSPEHEFYHRLLSEDIAAAVEQLDTASVEGASPGAVADSMILPALHIVARDHRNQRIGPEHVAALGETVHSVTTLFLDSFSKANPSQHPETLRQKSVGRVVIVIPARGPIDLIAAKFVAAMVSRTTRIDCIAMEQASGLMALAGANARTGTSRADTIIISTVGGIDEKLLRFLVRRAEKDFPDARIWVCDWGVSGNTASAARDGDATRAVDYPKLANVVEMLGYGKA